MPRPAAKPQFITFADTGAARAAVNDALNAVTALPGLTTADPEYDVHWQDASNAATTLLSALAALQPVKSGSRSS